MKGYEYGAVSKGFLVIAVLLIVVGVGAIGYMRSNMYLPPEQQKMLEAMESGNFAETFEKSIKDRRAADIADLTPQAEKGDIQAQRKLARVLSAQGTEESKKLAFQWATKAASNGDPSTSSELASYYECGIGTQVDISEAIRLYLPAANRGDVLSQYALSYLEKDPAKAQSWQDKVSKAMEKCKACDLPPMGCA